MPSTVVHRIIVRGKSYHIHERRVPEGYDGYIIYEGEFLCVVPLSATPGQLMNAAEEQIERLHGKE